MVYKSSINILKEGLTKALFFVILILSNIDKEREKWVEPYGHKSKLIY